MKGFIEIDGADIKISEICMITQSDPKGRTEIRLNCGGYFLTDVSRSEIKQMMCGG
jgi:hypothetical protein